MLAIVTCLLISTSPPADTPVSDAPTIEAGAPTERIPSAVDTSDPSGIEPEKLDAGELSTLRAGDDTSVYVITDQTLTAVNSGNSVVGDVVGSGAISLSENAFSGYNGIGNFVINTGHNNNLQGSISVSIATPNQ